MVRPTHVSLVLVLAVAGCGGAPDAPAPATPVAAAETSRAPAAIDAPEEPTEPPGPVFDPADLDQVAAVYRRVNQGDLTVFEEVGLTGEDGLPDAARVELYYQAVAAQRAQPATWDAFLARAGKP